MKLKERDALVERIRKLAEPFPPLSTDHHLKLKKLSGIRCIAFDFYGTMFISGVGDIGIDEDQEEDSEEIFRTALVETGFAIQDGSVGTVGLQILKQTLNRYISEAKQKGIEYPEPEIRDVWLDTLTKLVNRSFISGDLSRQKAIRFAVEFEFRINAIWPTPNLAKILTNLKEMGLELAIISNSQFYTPLAFEAIIGRSPEVFGFDPDLLVWSYVIGCKKPDISLYQHFINRAHQKDLAAAEILYVGNDIHKDIQPAKKLGMGTALFVGDSRSIRHEEAELENPSCRPDLIIDDLAQIEKCLEPQP